MNQLKMVSCLTLQPQASQPNINLEEMYQIHTHGRIEVEIEIKREVKAGNKKKEKRQAKGQKGKPFTPRTDDHHLQSRTEACPSRHEYQSRHKLELSPGIRASRPDRDWSHRLGRRICIAGMKGRGKKGGQWHPIGSRLTAKGRKG